MKSTINVSVEYDEGIIQELDKSKFFLLSKESATRIELFNFALALGVREGFRTKLGPSRGFTRTSYEDVQSFFYVYKSIYFNDVLSEDLTRIDDITNIDAALELAEEYANTGFGVLQKMKEDYPDGILFTKKLLTLIDDMRLEYESVFNVKTIYSE